MLVAVAVVLAGCGTYQGSDREGSRTEQAVEDWWAGESPTSQAGICDEVEQFGAQDVADVIGGTIGDGFDVDYLRAFLLRECRT